MSRRSRPEQSIVDTIQRAAPFDRRGRSSFRVFRYGLLIGAAGTIDQPVTAGTSSAPLRL